MGNRESYDIVGLGPGPLDSHGSHSRRRGGDYGFVCLGRARSGHK